MLATALSGGQLHFCAVSAGFRGCWGTNAGGALGLPVSTGFSQAAVPPPTGAPGVFNQLAAGNILSCGLLAGGAAWCWGTNTQGRLGNGATAAAGNEPPQAVVGGLLFSMVDAGGGGTTQSPVCGVTTAGAGYCWGSNTFGQLGSAAAVSGCAFGPCSGAPLPVAGGLTFGEIRTGGGGGRAFACGLLTGVSATIWCWGGNNDGQLGGGDLAHSPTPKRIQ